MTRRRLPVAALIGINVAVSIATTLLVLTIWDSRREPETLVLPTFSGVSAQTGASGGALEGGTPGAAPAPAGQEAVAAGGEEAAAAADATPGADYVIHVVQAGDTLFGMALQYGVSIEDIVIANNLESAEVLLDVGQELIMPVGGLPPTLTPTPTEPVPTLAIELTPIATVTPQPAGSVDVVIQDVLFPGDVTREAVFIVNQGARLDMQGWTLSDENDNVYTFPQLELFPDGGVTVHTGVGEDEANDLYWGLSVAVWGEPTDTATLRNPLGEVESEFPILP
jgi:LysM repeat protein